MSIKLNKGIVALTLSAGLFGFTASANADVLNFEAGQLAAAGVSADNTSTITDQFAATFGMEFSLVNPLTMQAVDALPLLTQIGNNPNGDAFINQIVDVADVAREGFEEELGEWFLRPKNFFDSHPGSLLITLTDGPTDYFTGQIWDIDGNVSEDAGVAFGTEQWRVVALDEDMNVIETIISPLGDSPDVNVNELVAAPWTWEFDHADSDIYAVRMDFIGTRVRGNAGFDNFSTVPTPGVATIFGLGALSMTKRRRKTA